MADVKQAIVKRSITLDANGEWPYRVPIMLIDADGVDGPQAMASAPYEPYISPGGAVVVTNIRGEWVVTGKR